VRSSQTRLPELPAEDYAGFLWLSLDPSAGLDVDVTPRLKAIFTGNYIRLDAVQSVEAILFQGNIHKTLGTDLSAGLRYRPMLNQNIVIVGGTAAFLPGRGFKDIYEKDRPLYHVFTNVILTF